MEYEVCALLNIKSEYLKDKFKNVYILNKRKMLIEYLLNEFGPFDVSKCEYLFNKHGFYTAKVIHSYVLYYSFIVSLLCSYVCFNAFTYNFILVFFIVYGVTLLGSIYAK